MEKENKLEKVGSFVSSTISKIVNAVIVVLIIALVGVIAWFWHNNVILVDKNEILQKQVEDLKVELKKVEEESKNNSVEEVKNVEVKDEENVVNNEVVKEGKKEVIKNVTDSPYGNQKGDYYCEKNSDCLVKSVDTCKCGSIDSCVNKGSDIDKFEAECPNGKQFMECNVHIKGCECFNNRCRSL